MTIKGLQESPIVLQESPQRVSGDLRNLFLVIPVACFRSSSQRASCNVSMGSLQHISGYLHSAFQEASEHVSEGTDNYFKRPSHRWRREKVG